MFSDIINPSGNSGQQSPKKKKRGVFQIMSQTAARAASEMLRMREMSLHQQLRDIETQTMVDGRRRSREYTEDARDVDRHVQSSYGNMREQARRDAYRRKFSDIEGGVSGGCEYEPNYDDEMEL